jgi:hypothetical protein
MKEILLIIGNGKTPRGYGHFYRIYSLDKYIGVKGHVKLHLHGKWERYVTPEKLRIALVNWKYNCQSPTITLSL